MESKRSNSEKTTKRTEYRGYKLVSEPVMTVYESEVPGPTTSLMNDACGCTGNGGCGGGGNWC